MKLKKIRNQLDIKDKRLRAKFITLIKDKELTSAEVRRFSAKMLKIDIFKVDVENIRSILRVTKGHFKASSFEDVPKEFKSKLKKMLNNTEFANIHIKKEMAKSKINISLHTIRQLREDLGIESAFRSARNPWKKDIQQESKERKENFKFIKSFEKHDNVIERYSSVNAGHNYSTTISVEHER